MRNVFGKNIALIALILVFAATLAQRQPEWAPLFWIVPPPSEQVLVLEALRAEGFQVKQDPNGRILVPPHKREQTHLFLMRKGLPEKEKTEFSLCCGDDPYAHFRPVNSDEALLELESTIALHPEILEAKLECEPRRYFEDSIDHLYLRTKHSDELSSLSTALDPVLLHGIEMFLFYQGLMPTELIVEETGPKGAPRILE